jgi:hypothetical protein
MNTLEIATMLGEHPIEVVLEVPDLDAARDFYPELLEALIEVDELSVGELARRLDLTRPDVSNHLACLRWWGSGGAARALHGVQPGRRWAGLAQQLPRELDHRTTRSTSRRVDGHEQRRRRGVRPTAGHVRERYERCR